MIVYYIPNSEDETSFARELHERVRREFPEVRIYAESSLLSFYTSVATYL